MKRVLIVGFDFPPQRASSAVRAAKLVKYRPRFGWLPTVIHPDMVTRWDGSLLGDIPAGVAVLQVGGWAGRLVRVEASAPSDLAPAGGNVGQRAVRLLCAAVCGTLFPDPQVVWVPGLVVECQAVSREKQPDVLLTTAPPFSIHLAGYLLQRRRPDLPWVADYQDDWSLVETGWQQELLAG
jgi:hypothetical protein